MSSYSSLESDASKNQFHINGKTFQYPDRSPEAARGKRPTKEKASSSGKMGKKRGYQGEVGEREEET